MGAITGNFACHFAFFICLPITFLAIFGFCRQHSLWEMAIKTFCVFFAVLFSLCLYEPLANLFDKKVLTWSYYNDMWAFLLIYSITLGIEVYVTNFLSRINVQLPAKGNRIGAFVIIGVLFLGFYSTGALLFYYTLPEKPDMKAVGEGNSIGVNDSLQFMALEYFSRGALSGKQEFHFENYYKNHFMRRCAVYSQADEFAKSTSSSSGDKKPWMFRESKSPNEPVPNEP